MLKNIKKKLKLREKILNNKRNIKLKEEEKLQKKLQKMQNENENYKIGNKNKDKDIGIELLEEINIKDSNSNINKTFSRLINPESVNDIKLLSINSQINNEKNNGYINNDSYNNECTFLNNHSYFNKSYCYFKNNQIKEFKFIDELINPKFNFMGNDNNNKLIDYNEIERGNSQKTRNLILNKNINYNINSFLTLTPIKNKPIQENSSLILLTNFENSLILYLNNNNSDIKIDDININTINDTKNKIKNESNLNSNKNISNNNNNDIIINEFKKINDQKFSCEFYLDKYVTSIYTCPGSINSNLKKEERKIERCKNYINFEMIEKNIELEGKYFLLNKDGEFNKNILDNDDFYEAEFNNSICNKNVIVLNEIKENDLLNNNNKDFNFCRVLDFDKDGNNNYKNEDLFEEKYKKFIEGKYKINNNEKIIFSQKRKFNESNKQIIKNMNNINKMKINKNMLDNNFYSLKNSSYKLKEKKYNNNNIDFEFEFSGRKKFNSNIHKKSKSNQKNNNSINDNNNIYINLKNIDIIPSNEFDIYNNNNKNKNKKKEIDLDNIIFKSNKKEEEKEIQELIRSKSKLNINNYIKELNKEENLNSDINFNINNINYINENINNNNNKNLPYISSKILNNINNSNEFMKNFTNNIKINKDIDKEMKNEKDKLNKNIKINTNINSKTKTSLDKKNQNNNLNRQVETEYNLPIKGNLKFKKSSYINFSYYK